MLHLRPVIQAVNRGRNDGAELRDLSGDPHTPPPSDAPVGEPNLNAAGVKLIDENGGGGAGRAAAEIGDPGGAITLSGHKDLDRRYTWQKRCFFRFNECDELRSRNTRLRA